MADMPDMSAYGIQPPGPNPMPVQAPMSAPGAYVPVTNNAIPLPPLVQYNIPQSAPNGLAPQPATASKNNIPRLSDIVNNAEKNLGRPLSKQEFQDAADQYKTQVLSHVLWSAKGATKDKVAAEVQGYDDAVNREIEKRYSNKTPADNKDDSSAIMAFLKSAGGQLAKVGGTALGMAGGAITSAGGLAPNKASDAFFSMANPNIQSDAQNLLPSLLAQRQKLLDFYANNPAAQANIKAQLDPKIQALQNTASGPNNPTEFGNAVINKAAENHPDAAFLGALGGEIAPYLIPGAQAIVAASEGVGNIGANSAQQLGEGQGFDKVYRQALLDAPLQAIQAYLPTKFGGKVLARALKGAGTNVTANVVQQVIDKAANDNNQFSGKSVLASGILGAGISALHGSGVSSLLTKLRKTPPKTNTNVPNPENEPSGARAPSSKIVDAVEADMTPKQAYTDLLNNNITTEGLPDQEFARLNNNISSKAELMAKKFKPPSSFDSPEDLVAASIKYAKALTKDKFYDMTPTQREELVGSLASWFGKRSKIGAEDISNAMLGLRNIPGSEGTATQTPETPAAPEPAPAVEGQAPKSPTQAPQAETASNAEYTPNTKYDPIWQAASDNTIPVSQLPAEMQGLATQVRNGRIPDRQAFDTVLQTAESRAGNKLKSKKPAQAPKQSQEQTNLNPPETNTPSAQTATGGIGAEDTNRLVNDLLKSRSNKTNIVAARKMARGLLTEATANGLKSDELKSLTLKGLMDKVKTAKNKKILAKTRVEPVQNPEEVTPEKPTTKNKLKKQTKKQTETQQTQDKANEDSASLYAASHDIPYAFMSSIRKAYGLSDAEVGAVWNRYKEAGLVKLDKKNPQNYTLKNDNLTKESMVRSTLKDAQEAGEIEGQVKAQTKGQKLGGLLKGAAVIKVAAKAGVPKDIAAPIARQFMKDGDVGKAKNAIQKAAKEVKSASKISSEELEAALGKAREEIPSPKTEAPAKENAGANKQTPLEKLLQERLGDRLPKERLDDLHNAIEIAQIGDKNDLTDLVQGLQDSGDISKSEAKWIKQLPKRDVSHDLERVVENNASGESSASLEAQHRVADERAAGRTRAVIRRNGTVEPLVGVDAVDTHARPGEVIVQRGIGRKPEEWTILSQGHDLSNDVAMGKVNRARKTLDQTHEEAQATHSSKDESVPEHTISPEEFETLYMDRTKGLENTPEQSARIAPLNVKREVDNIVQGIREGSNVQETGAHLKELSDKLEARNTQRKFNEANRGMRRGPEWVKSRLQRLIADSDPDSNHYAAAKMAQWLIDQNPNIADRMAISIRAMDKGEAGGFSPLTRILRLNANDLNKTTGLHELLHASERLLPPEIQSKLRGEYIGRIQNKLKKTTNEWARAYLNNAIRNFVNPNKSDELAMLKMLREHPKDVPAGEFYKYFDPSEYWAEEGSSILSRRYNADSWIGKAKQWLSEFGEHVKNVFDLDNNSQVVKGLNKILKAEDGEQPMLNKKNAEAKQIKDETDSKEYDAEQMGDEPSDEELGYASAKDADIDPNMLTEAPVDKKAKDLGDFNDVDKLIEASANSARGLEKTVEFANRENIPIDENNNVFDATYQKRNIASHIRETDKFEVVNPADDWVHNNYSKFANSTEEAYDLINDFYGNRNMLERYQTAWYMESPLDGTAEIDRGSIIEKLNDGDIDPDAARAQLEKLAKNHAVLDWREYAESKGSDVEGIEKTLKDLKNKGVDEQSLAEHNKLTQDIRDRYRNNLLKSGDLAKDDPYVKLYDWKWYVPQKGSPFSDKVDSNFDLIPDRNISIARLNKQFAVMKGRKSLTDKPYFRLLVDLARSADRVGHKEVMDKLYNLLTTEGANGQLALKKFGASIEVWHGYLKKGYTNAKGKHVDRLKAPANGIIINDGGTHYVVTLPHNSNLLRGLIQMDNIKSPKNKYVRGVSKVTNTLARLYTTLDPRWVATVGFARDITYVPLTMAATRFDNPIKAIPFIASYIPEIMGAYKALPTILPQIVGNQAAVRAAAEANPNGWAAMTLRYQAAGGSNYFTRGFDIGGVEKELLSRYHDTNGVVDLTKYGAKKVMDYTGNFANSLELLTRVAMFKQLIKEGMSDTEAGTQVRKIMDYEQSGTHGRLINAWTAFFRVGMTGTDAFRRAFTKKGGGLDYAKFGKWQLFMGTLGYLLYLGSMQLMGKDDDGKYKIQKINPNQLTSKAFFPVGDKIGSINLGLGIPQVLLAPGILAAALEQGHIDGRTAIKSYFDMLERNGPTSPGGAIGNNPADYVASAFFGVVPTALRPIIDTSRNTSAFSSPIHTQDPDRNKYNSDQGYPNTPKAYKEIATWIREHTGGAVDIFPEDIKYWVEGYGGSPVTDFTKWAFESGNVAAGGQAPMGRLAGSFFVDTSHYMSRDLFDALDTLAESGKRYNHLVSNAMHNNGLSRDQAKAKVSEVTNRDPAFAKRLQAYKDLLKAHKDYNAKVNSLRDNKLMSDTRKQLVRKQYDSQLRKSIEKAQSVIDNTEK